MTQHGRLPLTGGCQCGAQRYTVRTMPLTLYICHCTDCQAQSGSAFGMSLSVERDGIDAPWDRLKSWARPVAGGNSVVGFFCPECGTRLFHQPSRRPSIVNVKPGTLDDTGWLRPAGHIWTGSAQPWVVFDEGTLRNEGQPDGTEALYLRWQAMAPALLENSS